MATELDTEQDENNKILRLKARLVARGFTQIFGTDFDLTSSPTLNSNSLRFIIALASKIKMEYFPTRHKSRLFKYKS
ncbi:hypothetical protein PIROE2DRAFT_8003 [Piromyces sp. E2]|nr:hypothetical protein PIROE2DRAFT_8003 [Piromyces sp. E2]|eukprot:OUM65030.1 hypothetical protein PIROE2DRAFT_8003 [Piromyces sp. E2]